MNLHTRSIRSAALPILMWLLFNILAIGGLVVYQRAALLSELQAASFTEVVREIWTAEISGISA